LGSAAFSGLRWGELVALRRGDVDLDAGVIRVLRKLAALRNQLEFGPPKSEAGARAVALPAVALAALRTHLKDHVDDEAGSVVFTGEKKALLRTATSLGRSAGRRR
jgi:integrase